MAVETLNTGAVRTAMDQEPICGGVAADRIAAALGTLNAMGEKAAVTSFVVRRLITRSLLVDLSGNPEGTLRHLGQIAEVRA
ncbi:MULTISPECIES: hypothetical protein [unclassified Streptomyces]|uniref:hypothetical protein n=1 Tax=unclassified Streptomyces TaxID=2593676 RepID=UPI0006AFF740|nr:MULTISPECIES: hypothetical protein [unclassified Streptomyces]